MKQPQRPAAALIPPPSKAVDQKPVVDKRPAAVEPKPIIEQKPVEQKIAEIPAPSGIPDFGGTEGWLEVKDPVSRRMYYFNTITQKTSVRHTSFLFNCFYINYCIHIQCHEHNYRVTGINNKQHSTCTIL